MASMLRRTILLSLEKNRPLLVGVAEGRFPEPAGAKALAAELADDVACFIATEAMRERPERRSVFAWPPGATVIECEVLRPDGRWLRTELRGGRWVTPSASPWKIATRPLVWRHSPEIATDGGFGARHKGRPGQSVADADRDVQTTAAVGKPCHRCKGTGQEPPRERLFFPFAYGRPGGPHWLMENGHPDFPEWAPG